MDHEVVDHYRILGLPSGKLGTELTAQDIARAYRNKARALHPDKCHDNPEAHVNFQKLQSSYEILKDEQARKLFDDGLQAKRKRERHEPQYEPKRWKMVSELHKREKDSAFDGHIDPDEDTRKKLQEEIASYRIRAKHGNEVAANERHKRSRCTEKPPMKDVSDVVGADGFEALESCVLEKCRHAPSSSSSRS